MSSDVLILIFSSTVNTLISLLVLIRNYKKLANIAFAMTGLSLVGWSALNFVSSDPANTQTLLTTRFTGLLGALLITSFYFLSTAFPTSINPRKRTTYAIVASLTTICILSLTSLFIASAEHTSAGLELKEGSLYPLYPLYILVLFVLCNINFVRQYRSATRLARSQIKVMWIGISTTVGLIVVSNVIVPAITSSWSFSYVGTLFTIPFVAITAYAIIKKRMFEVRLIITRTVAYSITIGLVAAIYSVIVLVSVSYFTSFGELGPAQLITLVVPALFTALTFHSIQNYIDRISTRLFYRNAYDTKEVLDSLSSALMSTNNIDKILQSSNKILGSAIHSKSMYFVVFDESLNQYKDYPASQFPNVDLTQILTKMRHHKEILLEKDNMLALDSKLYEIMDTNNVEAILRLGSKNQPSGLLLLGVKNNGGIYTKQDTKLLEISAKNLVVALDNAFKYEQILHFADTMHNEVNRATTRLRNANKKLKTLDALKDDFIATASHQLRTPAASVHDTLQLLNHASITAKDRKELISLAEASSEHLVTVVRTMLNMARLQAGHFTIDKTTADLVEIVERVVGQIKVVADQKSTTIKLITPKYPLFLDVDVAKVHEALSNYIENAIKYSPDGSTIIVSLAESGSRIVFEVADQGMGVPIEEQKNLFGKFYRATNARKEQPDGNGIGLYVVKSIAEGHGGEAYYRSSDKGGSIFGLWFPTDS